MPQNQRNEQEINVNAIDGLRLDHINNATFYIGNIRGVRHTHTQNFGQNENQRPGPNDDPPDDPPMHRVLGNLPTDILADLLDGVSREISNAARRVRGSHEQREERRPSTGFVHADNSTNMVNQDWEQKLTVVAEELKRGDLQSYKEVSSKLFSGARVLKPRIKSIQLKGEELQNQQRYYEAVVLFQMVSKVALQRTSVPTNTLIHALDINTIQHSVAHLVQCCRHIKKDREGKNVCTNIIIPSMHDAIDDLGKLNTRDKDDVQNNIAWCYKCIGSAFIDLELYKEAAEAMTKGVNVMKNAFQESAQCHRIYGLLISSIGSTYAKRDQHKEAVEYFREAQTALEKSENWNSSEDKKDSLECNKHWMDESLSFVEGDDETLAEVCDKTQMMAICMKDHNVDDYEKNFQDAVNTLNQHSDASYGLKLFKKGKSDMKNRDFYAAISTFRLVSKALCPLRKVSNTNVIKVQHAAARLTDCFESLLQENDVNQILGNTYIFPAIEGVIDDLHNMPGADKVTCLENIAWCYKCMSSVSSTLGLHERNVEDLKKGLAIKGEEEIKPKVKFCRIFGLLKASLGVAFGELGDHQSAAKCFRDANTLLEYTTDWGDEDEKKKVIKTNEHNAVVASLKTKDASSFHQNMEFTEALEKCISLCCDKNKDEFGENVEVLAVLSFSLADDVLRSLFRTAEEYFSLGQYMHVIVTYMCIGNFLMQKGNNVDNTEIVQYRVSINKIAEATTKMVEQDTSSTEMVATCVIPLIEMVLTRLGFGTRHSVESGAWCEFHITEIYVAINRFEDARDKLNALIANMQLNYPANFLKHKIVSLAMLELSKIYTSLGDFAEAAKWSEEAKNALQASRDWEDDDPKNAALYGIDDLSEALNAQLGSANDCTVM